MKIINEQSNLVPIKILYHWSRNSGIIPVFLSQIPQIAQPDKIEEIRCLTKVMHNDNLFDLINVVWKSEKENSIRNELFLGHFNDSLYDPESIMYKMDSIKSNQ